MAVAATVASLFVACGGHGSGSSPRETSFLERPNSDFPACADLYNGEHLVTEEEQQACRGPDGTVLFTLGVMTLRCDDGGTLSWTDAGYVLDGVGYPHLGDEKVPPDDVRDACTRPGGASTRPADEVWLGYNCPGTGVEVRISDSGWTVGTDPQIHPEPNTAGEWSVDELLEAACG